MSNWEHNESFFDGLKDGSMSYAGKLLTDKWCIDLEFYREPKNPYICISETWDDYDATQITIALDELREIVKLAEAAIGSFGEAKVKDSIETEKRFIARNKARAEKERMEAKCRAHNTAMKRIDFQGRTV